MKPTQAAIVFVLAVLVAAGGFVAGMTVARAGTAATPNASSSPAGDSGAAARRGGAAGGAQGGAGGFGAQATNGRVISVNNGSITIELRQPGAQGAGASPALSSQIVLVAGSTRIVKTTETDIKLTDLKPNDQITVVGTTDASSGLMSATAIVVGGNALQGLFPGGGAFGGAGGASRSPSPSPSPTR